MKTKHYRYVREYKAPQFELVLKYLDDNKGIWSPKTEGSYYYSLSKWLRFCTRRKVDYKPTVENTKLYINYLLDECKYKLSGIDRWLMAHKNIEIALDIGFTTSEVREMKRFKARRAKSVTAKDRYPGQAKPWRNSQTQQYLKLMDPNDKADMSVAAYIMLAYWGGMRGDEVARLERDDIFIDPNGLEHEVVIWETKTDKSGRGHKNRIPDSAMYWIRSYIDMLPRWSTSLWPPMRGTGFSKRGNISTHALASRFKRVVERHGFEGYSSHSMRVGCADDMYHNGFSTVDANKHFHWSPGSRSYDRYIENAVSMAGMRLSSRLEQEHKNEGWVR